MELIEIGQIVNTHGIRGEVRVQPWCDSPGVLCALDTVYIGGKAYSFSGRPHKRLVIAELGGVGNVTAAASLRDKIISAEKSLIPRDEDSYFIKDLIGLSVTDSESGGVIGEIADVLTLPANDVYVVRGEREYMIPAVAEFIKSVDLGAGEMRVKLLKGMASDED